MHTGRILKTGLAVGVVANVYDFVTNTYLFPLLGSPPAIMKDMADLSIQWLVVNDFVMALVFVWFFDKVRAAFGPGAGGGAGYGLAIGIVMNFPLWITMSLIMRDFSYGTAWMWTIMGVVWAVIMGAVAGAVYDMTGEKPAAATG
ncbi:MAG: hypothetical protein OEW77_08065 [Gemmatimonadota bacterium]|nr:hypothetical protein [Gemmatimonadota bacterium]